MVGDPINSGKPDEAVMVDRVWKALTPNLSIQEDFETTKAVLLKGMQGSAQDPDLALSLWCRALLPATALAGAIVVGKPHEYAIARDAA